MNKLAQQRIASYYYNLGSQSALGMNKTAGIGNIAARTGGGLLGASLLSAPGMKGGMGVGAFMGSLPFIGNIQKSGLSAKEYFASNPEAMKQVLESAEFGGGLGLLTALGLGGFAGQHAVKRLMR